MSRERDRISAWKRIDQIKGIAAERKRLAAMISKTPNDRGYRWVHEWLAKSDEQHFADGVDIFGCKECGKAPRFIWRTSFSFCKEYGCGLIFCDDCILKLAQRVLAAAKEDVR